MRHAGIPTEMLNPPPGGRRRNKAHWWFPGVGSSSHTQGPARRPRLRGAQLCRRQQPGAAGPGQLSGFVSPRPGNLPGSSEWAKGSGAGKGEPHLAGVEASPDNLCLGQEQRPPRSDQTQVLNPQLRCRKAQCLCPYQSRVHTKASMEDPLAPSRQAVPCPAWQLSTPGCCPVTPVPTTSSPSVLPVPLGSPQSVTDTQGCSSPLAWGTTCPCTQ